MVELYEYKVADALAGGEPRGGKHSLRDLRQLLMNAPLAGGTLRRFRQADKALRAGSENIKPIEVAPVAVVAASLDTNFALSMEPSDQMASIAITQEIDSALDEEGLALRALAEAGWRSDLFDELHDLASKLRNEAGRPTARILYATLHNLDQYADHPEFSSDLNLAKFQIISTVPAPNDPLANFSTSETITNLLDDLANRLLGFHGLYPKMQLAHSEVLSYFRRFALQVAEHPTGATEALQQQTGPRPKEIQAAIDQVRKENMAPEAKQQMIDRLQRQLSEALAKERSQASGVSEERRALKNAAEQFFGWLADRLPTKLGGKAKEPHVHGKLLNAQQEQRQLERPETGTDEVALRLARPGFVELRGVHIQYKQSPEGWVLEVSGAEYPLRDGMRVPVESREVLAFVRDAYVLLRVRERDGGGLWPLLAKARTVAALLEPQNAHQNLRLARATAGWMRDRRVEIAQHAPETAERYASAPEHTLTAFARTGAEKLLERFSKNADTVMIERAFAAAAEAFNEEGAEEAAAYLASIFQGALEPAEIEPIDGLELRQPDEVLLIPYRGEPVTVRVMGRAFTVRTDNLGKVYALMPGGSGQALEDVLPQRMPGGFALLAREGLRIAIGFMPTA